MDVDQGLKWAGETLGLHRCGPLKWPVPRKVLGGKCMKRAAAMKLSLAELVEFNCRHLTNEYLKKLANEFYDHYKEFVKKDQVKHQRAKAHGTKTKEAIVADNTKSAQAFEKALCEKWAPTVEGRMVESTPVTVVYVNIDMSL
jgi:hypothetical protein